MDPLEALVAEQLHIVRVFVFRRDQNAIEYLAVRQHPVHESFWSPLKGVLRPNESIFQAAVRSVDEEVGLGAPRQIVDLQLATHITIGDLEEIDWSVGYRARSRAVDLRPSNALADARWLDFDAIYRNLSLEADRRSIMRLHFTLRSAS